MFAAAAGDAISEIHRSGGTSHLERYVDAAGVTTGLFGNSVTANVFSHSGIEQGTIHHNVVRFVRGGSRDRQHPEERCHASPAHADRHKYLAQHSFAHALAGAAALALSLRPDLTAEITNRTGGTISLIGVLGDPDGASGAEGERFIARFVEDLGRVYLETPALWAGDHEADGFAWIDASDVEASVYSYIRRAGDEPLFKGRAFQVSFDLRSPCGEGGGQGFLRRMSWVGVRIHGTADDSAATIARRGQARRVKYGQDYDWKLRTK